MFIGDLRGHARKISSLLLFANAGSGPLKPSLIPDERVVRGAAIKTQHRASMFAFGVAFFVGVADDGHDRNDQINIARRTTGFGGSGSNLRNNMTFQISRFADGMNMHTVGDLARHLQHPRIHRGDINLWVGSINLAGTPLWCDECQFIKLAVVFERSATKSSETGFDCQDVIAQAWTRTIEGNSITTHHVGLYLSTKAQTKATTTGLLKFPRR